MFTYGFYNSKEGDRKYNSEQISHIFDGIIEDGVYSNVGEALMVVPGTGMQVIVKTGRAWFKHTWSLNDSYLPLSIDSSDVYRGRIDAVVLEVDSNLDVRANSIRVVKGEPATTAEKPAMKHEEGIDQYALAYVTVDPGADAIVESKIEIAVGKNETPFVQCPLKTVSIEDLFNQWQGEFDEWFDNVQSQLEGDIATNLQNQIDQRVKIADKATTDDLKNKTPNKWVDASMLIEGNRYAASPGTVISSEEDLEALDPDHWAQCDQRPMPISRIGKDLGRLPYGEWITAPNINGINSESPDITYFIENTNPNRLYYASDRYLSYFDFDDPTNIHSIAPSLTSRYEHVVCIVRNNFVIWTYSSDATVFLYTYTCDGAVIKSRVQIANGVGNTAIHVGIIGSRIILFYISSKSNNHILVYSDDYFNNWSVDSGSDLLPNSLYANSSDPITYISESIDNPFFTNVAKDSLGRLYVVLNIDSSGSDIIRTFVIYRTSDGISWSEVGRYTTPRAVLNVRGWRIGITNDNLYILYYHKMLRDATNYYHIPCIAKFKIDPFVLEQDVLFDKNKYLNNMFVRESKYFVVGEDIYILINNNGLVKITMSDGHAEYYPFYVAFRENLSQFTEIENGDIIIPCAIDAIYDGLIGTYMSEKYCFSDAYKMTLNYIRCSKGKTEIYSGLSESDSLGLLSNFGNINGLKNVAMRICNHPTGIYIFLYNAGSEQKYVGCVKIDKTKNLLPYKPDHFIALNPPET